MGMLHHVPDIKCQDSGQDSQSDDPCHRCYVHRVTFRLEGRLEVSPLIFQIIQTATFAGKAKASKIPYGGTNLHVDL